MTAPPPTARLDAHLEQRAFRAHHGSRLRVLVETADRALLVSDFRFLVDAGFDVATCGGPGDDLSRCPALRGEACGLVAQADVVLHALDPDLHVAAAIKLARPDLPVVVERPRRDAAHPARVPEGCVPLDMPSSVAGQLEAIRRVARR